LTAQQGKKPFSGVGVKAILENIKQITLGKLLVALSAFSLVLAFLLVLFLANVVSDRAVHELARADARQTSKLVFESLYSAMRKGWNKEEIKEVIQRLNEAIPELKIDVYRGEIVERQFGAMPGEGPIIAADPPLANALRDGKDAMLIAESGNSIRYLYPVQASEECLVCHTQSFSGAIHGVIDITYPIDRLKVSIAYVINSIIVYFLLILSVVFVALFFNLRYLVLRPIASMVGLMQKITHEMDFGLRVTRHHWISELQLLSEYFNRLLNTVQEYNSQLEELSVRDPLTNLYNRRKFDEFMQHEIIRATRNQRGFSVIMIDLDNFKYINDTFGHPIGDMVIKELAVMLAGELRKGDVLARMGGDEFAIILPETDAAKGIQVANKLHQTLADKEFELPVGKIHSTASFSLVNFPDDGQTADQIYSAMDVVLYKAKTRGKNQVMTAKSDEDRSMMTIFKQGNFLRNAIREDRIEAFLQPIVDLQTSKVIAFEVLARIRDGDLVTPAGEFIDAAGELGMAKELDREVFRKGLAQYAKVSAQYPEVLFFFNLFPYSFNDLGWIRGIPDMVRQAGIPCEKIVLEITEREALPNLTQVRAVIAELLASKITVALDDFGSGFSSFLYMKYLAIDYVKIEGSFVRHMAIDERDRIIVEQINSMAHKFGLKTVADFVEVEATAKILAEIGVDFAQGYYFGYPIMPE
jgi:diguanylate cyclase (GGDEF)-like protein